MAGKEPPKTRTSRPPQVASEDFPVTSSYGGHPSGDYSYTLEVVMGMQATLGKLTEAVEALKDQGKEHTAELKTVAKDVHAAKVVFGVVGGLILLVAGFIAWIVNTYISTHPAKP